MTDEEIRMQYRFTHHALVELYKLCKTLGSFKNGVEHQGTDEGEVYASGVFDRVEAVLRGEHYNAHKVMTPEEYAGMPLIGWHEVCRDVDGCGAVGVRFLSSPLTPADDTPH